jgi:hypothetical protein
MQVLHAFVVTRSIDQCMFNRSRHVATTILAYHARLRFCDITGRWREPLISFGNDILLREVKSLDTVVQHSTDDRPSEQSELHRIELNAELPAPHSQQCTTLVRHLARNLLVTSYFPALFSLA